MGRPRVELPDDLLCEMLANGMKQKDIAAATGVSAPTVAKETARLRAEQGDLLDYREVEHLQVTRLKQGILARLEEKLQSGELPPDVQISLLTVLNRTEDKKKEIGQVEGLMGHLMAMERERIDTEKIKETNALLKTVAEKEKDIIDITPASEGKTPRLGIND